jgi:hypothetical protein
MYQMVKGETRTFQFDFKLGDGSAYDLTGHSLIEVIFQKPDGTRDPKSAVLNGAAAGGSFKYSALKDEINQAGPWRAWGHFEIGTPVVSDAKYSQSPIEFFVQEAP